MYTSVNRFAVLTLMFIAAGISGCGRYIAPISPEDLVAKPVESLSATYNLDNSVTLTWLSPDVDKRNKKLKELEGYQIERAEGGKNAILTDVPLEKQFEKEAFIPDTYFVALRKKQQDAEERGDIVRKVKLDNSSRTFSYTIKNIPQGITIYRIYAVNSEGGDGEIAHVVQVTNDEATKTATIISQAREIY
jgi:hypothetical protein